jgi:glutaredoxin 3
VFSLVNKIACPSCDVQVMDMQDSNVAARARQYGVRTVPAVVIDGKLDDCCVGPGVEEAVPRAAERRSHNGKGRVLKRCVTDVLLLLAILPDSTKR